MKKKQKIYAIPGMMEYQTRVFVGRNAVKISFAGGSINNGCARPARFYTSDLIIQNAIESSADFRRGLIRIERVIELNEEIPVERPRKMPPHPVLILDHAPSQVCVANASEVSSSSVGTFGSCVRDCESIPQSEAALSPDDKGQCEAVSDPESGSADFLEDSSEASKLTAESSQLQIVEVSCKDVAKAYLQDHFGENPTPLRKREDVQKCAAKYGITFKFD